LFLTFVFSPFEFYNNNNNIIIIIIIILDNVYGAVIR